MRTNRTLITILALGALLAASAALGISASPARAAACPPPPPVFYPVTQWGDANKYVQVMGGSVEPDDASWSLSGGASIVSDNAPSRLDRSTDLHALYLPAGSSATSACVTAPRSTACLVASRGTSGQAVS